MSTPRPRHARTQATLPMVRRLWHDYLSTYQLQIALALVFMVLAGGMTALFARMVQPVLDDVMVGRDESMILPVAIGFFVIFVLRGFATYAHTMIMQRVGQYVIRDVQKDMCSRFLDLDLRFFHDNPSGQLISRILSDVNVMRGAMSETLTSLGKSLITLVFLIAVMVFQDWRLSVVAFLILPFSATMVAYIGRRLRKISGNIQENSADLTHMLSQIFQGIRLVKAYGMESAERARTGSAIDRVRALMIKSAHVDNMSTPINETLIGAVVFGIILYGGHRVTTGDTTVGALISFIFAFLLAYEPMKKLIRLNAALQIGLGAAERVFSMLDTRPAVQDSPSAQELSSALPEIRFDNVIFRYHEDAESRPALGGVSFTLPRGQVTALVGPSGGGKSTILNLIPRFYDVSGGAITIDGTDIRQFSLASLRRHIALVSQDITIFDDTIRGNIAYGTPEASDSAIIAAARAAAAHDFIMEAPDGYDTRVGESGLKLSGGQRQRLAIARAILHGAPVLLLDEATSALDTDSERAIQETLATLQKGKTTLVIAHRLSTVRNADQILVLKDGEIVERGKHDALCAQEGLYARLYKTGSIENEDA